MKYKKKSITQLKIHFQALLSIAHNVSIVTAERSVRPYIAHEKILVFVFLSVGGAIAVAHTLKKYLL